MLGRAWPFHKPNITDVLSERQPQPQELDQKKHLLYVAFSTKPMPETIFVDLSLMKGRFGDFLGRWSNFPPTFRL